ncbi:hypothetical protein Tco_1552140, partial [Tanacetum coccineum]
VFGDEMISSIIQNLVPLVGCGRLKTWMRSMISQPSARSMSTTLDDIRSAIVGDGNRLNRESNSHGNLRSRPKKERFFYARERDQSPKQVWRQDDLRTSDEEGDGVYGNFVGGPRGISHETRIVRRNDNHHGYGDRQGYRVKAEIFNFDENLDIEAMLDWLYKVGKFFDIMDVPKKSNLELWLIKCEEG